MTNSRIRVAGLVIALLMVAASAFGDEVNSAAIPLHVEYADGTTDDLIVRYRGIVHHRQWQTGEPSRPLKGQIPDTRQCHWNTSGYIERDVCVISKAAGEVCRGELSDVFLRSSEGSGEAFHILKNWQGENCGKAGGAIRQTIDKVRRAVLDNFDAEVKADLDIVIGRLLTATVTLRVSVHTEEESERQAEAEKQVEQDEKQVEEDQSN